MNIKYTGIQIQWLLMGLKTKLNQYNYDEIQY
jgi:hypothetical protein